MKLSDELIRLDGCTVLLGGSLDGLPERAAKLELELEELTNKNQLADKVRSLVQTVAWNSSRETMVLCAKQWGLMDENGKLACDKSWPPHPKENTVMRDGHEGIEKDFTKLWDA